MNFWVGELKSKAENVILSNKIIDLIKSTFNHIDFKPDELVALARVEAIFKNN